MTKKEIEKNLDLIKKHINKYVLPEIDFHIVFQQPKKYKKFLYLTLKTLKIIKPEIVFDDIFSSAENFADLKNNNVVLYMPRIKTFLGEEAQENLVFDFVFFHEVSHLIEKENIDLDFKNINFPRAKIMQDFLSQKKDLQNILKEKHQAYKKNKDTKIYEELILIIKKINHIKNIEVSYKEHFADMCALYFFYQKHGIKNTLWLYEKLYSKRESDFKNLIFSQVLEEHNDIVYSHFSVNYFSELFLKNKNTNKMLIEELNFEDFIDFTIKKSAAATLDLNLFLSHFSKNQENLLQQNNNDNKDLDYNINNLSNFVSVLEQEDINKILEIEKNKNNISPVIELFKNLIIQELNDKNKRLNFQSIVQLSLDDNIPIVVYLKNMLKNNEVNTFFDLEKKHENEPEIFLLKIAQLMCLNNVQLFNKLFINDLTTEVKEENLNKSLDLIKFIDNSDSRVASDSYFLQIKNISFKK